MILVITGFVIIVLSHMPFLLSFFLSCDLWGEKKRKKEEKEHMGKSLWIYVYSFMNDKFSIVKNSLLKQGAKSQCFFFF